MAARSARRWLRDICRTCVRPVGAAVGAAALLGGGSVAFASEKKGPSFPKSSNELFYDTLARHQRAIYLSGSIDDASAKTTIGQLLTLEFEKPGEPITMYITSRGGKVHSGLGIIDVMRFITSPVRTVCVGHCESMGAIILAAGERGQRFALPNARMMIHEPVGVPGHRQTAEEIRLRAEQLQKTRDVLCDMLVECTGKERAVIEKAFERDTYVDVAGAQELGLIDHVACNMAAIDPDLAAELAAKKEARAAGSAKEAETSSSASNGDTNGSSSTEEEPGTDTDAAPPRGARSA